MESVYAALLLHKADKPIDEVSIEKVLKAAAVKADKNQIKALVAGLDGKNIDELIASASAAPVMAAPAAGGAPVEKKEKKKEKEPEKEEEPAGLGALFG
ncbi:MAG: 50S ribosomal protein P1 [Promethearchaeota archaeon]